MNASFFLRSRMPAVTWRLRVCRFVVACCLLTGLWLGTASPVPVDAMQMLPCNDLLGCIEIPAGQPVVVGGLFARTGPDAAQGVDQARAAALAIADFDTVLGHEIELQEQDLSDMSCGVSATHLASLTSISTLVGLVGPSCNGAVRDVLHDNLHQDLPLVSPAATDSALFVANRSQGGVWQPGFYSVAPSDLHQGILLARYAVQTLGVHRLLVVDDAQPERDALRSALETAFQIYGGQIVSREALTPGTGPVIPLLERAALLEPDALYLPTDHQDALRLVQAISSMPALRDVLLLVSANWLTADIARLAQATDLAIYAAGPYVTPQQVQAFDQRWQDVYPQPPATLMAPHAYDGTSLLLQAVRLTAIQDVHGNLSLGRLALRQTLERMTGFPGYTGVLTCTSSGPCGVNESWGLYRLPAKSDAESWPPVLLQAPQLLASSRPQYQGRIMVEAPVRSGPYSQLPILRTLAQHATVPIIGVTPDRAWIQMPTGGWLSASHVELYPLGLPVVSTPLSSVMPTPPALHVGDPHWPVPQAQRFRAPDGMAVRVTALLRQGDPGYVSTAPPYTTNNSQCPLCGHVAIRVGLTNLSGERDHYVYLQDFSLHLVQDHEGFPAHLEATALRCNRRIFALDRVMIRSGVGEVTRDLCFAVTDITRVSWLYNLVYESASEPQEPHDTAQPEFAVHFSLR